MTNYERHERIQRGLVELENREIIRGWQCQGDKPGLRWFVEGFTFDTRGLSTAEAENFILGANSAWEAAKIAAAPALHAAHAEGALG